MTDRSPRPSGRPPNGGAPRVTHRCPGGCGAQIPDRHLACRDDWYRLPRGIRDLFSHGQGRRSAAQMNALRAAVEWYADNPRQEN